ncbi:MAG TPA: hypothetical protein VJA16_08835, partial [Thermoanaerobaculia bacterium]
MKAIKLALFYLSMPTICSLPAAASALTPAERAIPRELLGDAKVEIAVMRMPAVPGDPPVDELPAISSDRKRERQAQIEACFAHATWLLNDDGTFEFRPFPRAGIVDHVAGDWSVRGQTIELHSRPATEKRFWDTSLDGSLQPAAGTYRLDIVAVGLGIDPELVVAVHQSLLAGERPPVIAVESWQLPALYDVELSATQDGRRLPVRSAALRLLAPAPGATAPLAFRLETAIGGAGTFVWSSSRAADPRQHLRVERGELRFDLTTAPTAVGIPEVVLGRPHTKMDELVVSFPFVLGDPGWIGYAVPSGAAPEPIAIARGSFAVSLHADLIEGEIHAIGAGTDGRRVSYDGSLKGRRRQPFAPARAPDLMLPQEPATAGDPGRFFDIEISGNVDGYEFSALPEKLFIQRQGKSEYRVTLTPSGTVIRRGWTFLRGTMVLDRLPLPGQRLCSHFVPRDQSLASISQADWFTGAAASAEKVDMVFPQVTTLCYAIDAQEIIVGEVDGAGISLGGDERPSRLHAAFHGKIAKSPLASQLADRLRKRGLTGDWRLTGGAGDEAGWLSLAGSSGSLHGSLTPPAGATIQLLGTETETTATLATTDGSGLRVFLRPQANGETLIALVESSADGAASLLGRRRPASLSSPAPPEANESDAFELMQLGIKLELDHKCGDARLALEQALAIY